MAITKGICYRHLDGLTDEEFDALEKEISGVIDTLDNDDFSDIYQEYAIYNHYPRVYSNCDYVINDMLSWASPWQIVKKHTCTIVLNINMSGLTKTEISIQAMRSGI